MALMYVVQHSLTIINKARDITTSSNQISSTKPPIILRVQTNSQSQTKPTFQRNFPKISAVKIPTSYHHLLLHPFPSRQKNTNQFRISCLRLYVPFSKLETKLTNPNERERERNFFFFSRG
jgi:hypothetical protein